MMRQTPGDLGEGNLVVLKFNMKTARAVLVAAVTALSLSTASVAAQDSQSRTVRDGRYIPTI